MFKTVEFIKTKSSTAALSNQKVGFSTSGRREEEGGERDAGFSKGVIGSSGLQGKNWVLFII